MQNLGDPNLGVLPTIRLLLSASAKSGWPKFRGASYYLLSASAEFGSSKFISLSDYLSTTFLLSCERRVRLFKINVNYDKKEVFVGVLFVSGE